MQNISPRLAPRRPKGTHFKTIVAVVLFVALALFVYIFPNAARVAGVTFARPFWIVRNNATRPFTFVRDFFAFKSSLISKNLALENEVASLRLKQVDYDTLLKENQNLMNQVGGESRIIARVLSKPPQSPYDTLVLANGSDDGVALGNKVYLSDTIIIGNITSVTSRTSVAQLFSSGSQKEQTTLSRTGTTFEIVGAGAGNFQLEVPKETDVIVGDTFLYPSVTASVLASVYSIENGSQSSFKKIYLRIPGNIFSTQWLFIEKF
jgi:cell shape-determining protein MreC